MDYEQKHPILQKLEEYFKYTPKEQIDKDWSNILKDTDSESFYEKRYKEALEKVRGLLKDQEMALHAREKLANIFPELKESEGDNIKKELIAILKGEIPYTSKEDADRYIAWLEKQGENKPANKVEPKFHEGEWISGYYKITAINSKGYVVEDTDGNKINILFENEKFHHLFTIADAKDGDVLVNGSNIFIFHFLNDTRLMGYCHVNIDDGKFYDDTGKNECFCLIDAVVNPATKEQRDLLFQKIKEAGYEWDSEKKELKKIESKALDADKVIEWPHKYWPFS